ncbi:MAG: hypothetical protein EXR07_01505 [Acetobacteraceae bacterium]|nr:hypothetical protein [Acetobacteraceae bacterium]
MIVIQPNFWTDQPSVAALQRMVDSGRFMLAAQFSITSEDPSRLAVIRVYRNLEPTARTGKDLEIKLPPLRGAISRRL